MRTKTFRQRAATSAAAAFLALGLVGASQAAPVTAAVSVTYFSVTTSAVDAYVWAVDTAAFQQWAMTALNAGGLNGAASNDISANDLNPLSRLAQTSLAEAKGSTVQFTDNTTQLTTTGLTLGARATPSLLPPVAFPNSGEANATQSGGFTLIDALGGSVAGDLSFTLFYDLGVDAGGGTAPTQMADASLSLLASSDAGGAFAAADALSSGDEPGGMAQRSGSFTWAFQLAAGEAAYYTLSGTALAQAVPEPHGLALLALSLAGAACATRRRPAGNAA
jgi:hypothetical protein